MKTIKVSEATPVQLDWMVAKCEEPVGGYKAWVQADLDKGVLHGEHYSTDWTWGGPILEREGGTFWSTNASGWRCKARYDHANDKEGVTMGGATLLIAAMRCYVASKLGDEVEIPEALK